MSKTTMSLITHNNAKKERKTFAVSDKRQEVSCRLLLKASQETFPVITQSKLIYNLIRAKNKKKKES